MHHLFFNLKGKTVVRAALCAAAALAVTVAAGWTQPVQAGIAGLSYQEVTHVMFEQSTTPAPGAYFTGSFPGDYQLATSAAAPKKGGLIGALQWASAGLKSLKNGFADTKYYWNGMQREDKPDGTSSIDIPAKNERIELNLAQKTYAIIDETPQSSSDAVESPEPMPQMPQGTPPPQEPGTAIVFVTTTKTALGPKLLDNVPTQGYKVTSDIRWTAATGSCKNDAFQAGGTLIEYVSKYQQPSLAPRPMPKMTMPAALPSMPALPSLQSLQQAMESGCKPTIKANIQKGVNIPSGIIVWQYLGAKANMQNQSENQEGQEQMQELGALGGSSGNAGFGTLIERGSFRVLGPADASLFQVPSGFRQVSGPDR